jgi:hypothetical protein
LTTGSHFTCSPLTTAVHFPLSARFESYSVLSLFRDCAARPRSMLFAGSLRFSFMVIALVCFLNQFGSREDLSRIRSLLRCSFCNHFQTPIAPFVDVGGATFKDYLRITDFAQSGLA